MDNQRAKGAVLSYVSIFINTLIQLLYTPFLIRMLGQSEYGLYSLVASIIGYLTVLDLGFGNAIIVYTTKYRAQENYDAEKKLHGMFKIVFIVIAVISALLGLLLYFNIDVIFSNTMTSIEISKIKTMTLILSLNLFITFSFNIYTCIIGAYEKFVFQKTMSIIHSILKPILMIPLLFLGYKSITMCIVITAINIFVTISNYLFCKKKLGISVQYNGFDKKIFKIIIGYSIWIFIGVVVDKINWSLDNFILGAVSGAVAVSIYSVASTLNQLFCNLSTAISGVLLPKISKMVAKNASDEALTNEFIKIGRIQFYVVFLMASGLVLIGKDFFMLWAGKGYEDSYYIALLLILPVCIPLIQNIGISIMQAKNLHKFRSLLLLFIAIANIFLSIPLAKQYGGIGAAIGTAISLLIGNGLIINIYYYKKVGINIFKFWKEIIIIMIPNILLLGLFFIIKQYTYLTGILNIIVYGGLYTLLYLILVYSLSMNDYEKDIINRLLNRVHIKKETMK